MEIKDMINDTSIIFLNEKYKSDILEAMISKAVEEGYIKDETSFKKAINERETMGSTGIGDEIAIPHARGILHYHRRSFAAGRMGFSGPQTGTFGVHDRRAGQCSNRIFTTTEQGHGSS